MQAIMAASGVEVEGGGLEEKQPLSMNQKPETLNHKS
jgi:hypothetical protein